MRPTLLVVHGDRASLLGRNWFASLGIGVAGTHQTSTGPAALQPLLDKFRSVFNADLTSYTGLPVHLELLEGVTTKFVKTRPVPHTLHPAIETKFD